jgi:hypothetical protein
LECAQGRDCVDFRGCWFPLDVKIGWRSQWVLDGTSVASPWFVWTPVRSRLAKNRLIYRRLWSRWVQLIVARTSLLWVGRGGDRTEGGVIAPGCGLWL